MSIAVIYRRDRSMLLYTRTHKKGCKRTCFQFASNYQDALGPRTKVETDTRNSDTPKYAERRVATRIWIKEVLGRKYKTDYSNDSAYQISVENLQYLHMATYICLQHVLHNATEFQKNEQASKKANSTLQKRFFSKEHLFCYNHNRLNKSSE